ncbi:metallophosphoesterase family protein [Candidatus Spongiisocius sp.]|uniref:metallophosphoesterase family protein n=1 Tax=Candidatus Spongiisocius sp. TaxID=3101273 RepID=UPI003B5A36FC
MPRFDRSDVPEADLEFVVLADTHHLVDPGMYSATGDSVTPEIVREWSDRGDWALALAKATEPAFVFHVGDLAQEYPGSRFFDTGRQAAVTQFEESGLEVNFAAGNMDIGDKPDPTVPAGWVEPGFLKRWDEDFGKSFYSRTAGDTHFIVLNSQIMNTTLPEAIEQREWVDADLAAHASHRIFMFLHLPPYLVDEDEPGLGSYDVLDNPDRAWLLDLCRSYDVEALFSGHTHFQVFNRAGDTRLYTLPSTTTTRPGFYEAFNVRPADRGWLDTAKLGFFLVRVTDRGTSVHLIRTSGETHANHRAGTHILSGTIVDLPHSPVAAYLRLPITNKSDGAISYPNHVRHRIRDDYPLLSCVEAGIRNVRFPIHDLDVSLQAGQLAVLRREGVELTATVLCPRPGDITAAARKATEADFIEVQLTNRFFPDGEDLAALAELREAGVRVALAPLALEDTGKVHLRSRTGFRPRELPQLDEMLTGHGLVLDRAVCMVDGSESVWSDIRAFDTRLRSVGGLDFLVPLDADDEANALAAAEALFAAATMPGCRVYLDPLQDLDRVTKVVHGLLDRLSNPRPAFYVTRVLNTVLFGEGRATGSYSAVEPGGGANIRAIEDRRCELWLVTENEKPPAAEALRRRVSGNGRVRLINPVAGTSWRDTSGVIADLVASPSSGQLLVAQIPK